MRVAEKTVELNFCKGFPRVVGHDLLWFGLTQKQEAKAGFDACAKSGSTLLLFQLKASRVVLKDGTRRFSAEHDQMQILRNQVKPNRRVYYVLPVIGTTAEICGGLCFSHCSRYLDVSKLPGTIPSPLAKGKSPPAIRKNNCHYIDMAPSLKKATVHSDPFEVELLGAGDLASTYEDPERIEGERHSDTHQHQMKPISGVSPATEDFREFWSALCRIDRTGLFGSFAV